MKSLLLASLIAGLTTVRPPVASATSFDTLSVAEAVQMENRVFDALQHDDQAAWQTLVAADFRAFERGKIYDANTFFGMVAGLHKSGARAQWSVTDPHVVSRGGLFTLSYVNSGSLNMKGEEPKPMRWLETVTFRQESEAWKLVLLTSMRMDDQG